MTAPQQDSQPRYTASDVPALRRSLADWYGTQGTQFYYNAITLGQQPIRPPGPAGPVARQLAAAETGRLRDGDLWYVDEDLCALVDAAHSTMPAFAPRPSDLPSPVGFAVFAEPIAVYPAEDARRDDVIDAFARTNDSIRDVAERLYQKETRIIAASWGPLKNPNWKADGVWMSFYAPSGLFSDGMIDEETARRARAMLPPLTVDNEAALSWRPDGEPVDKHLLHSGETGTIAWARLLFAIFQLAAQTNLAETAQERTPRPERRRTERAGLPGRDVRIIRLRRNAAASSGGGQEGASREWRHRWIVRGHWRNHWYPSLSDHRPTWIAPYPKGPADAPLIGGEKVNVVGAPPEVSET